MNRKEYFSFLFLFFMIYLIYIMSVKCQEFPINNYSIFFTLGLYFGFSIFLFFQEKINI